MQSLPQAIPQKTLNSANQILLALTFLVASGPISARTPDPERGKKVFYASGGCGCHTDVQNDGPFMGGGRGIKTPFGIFFGSNITPHPEEGVGRWSDEDFIRAMTLGMAPDGRHYFPVFPYTSFRLMNKEDLLHLKDYLFSLPISSRVNTEHDVPFPFNWRPPLFFWKLLFLEKGSYQPDPSRSKSWNRGAYLSNALAHCGECHTPRNLLGGLNPSMHYAGSEEGPEGELTPNITPDLETGIGNWSIEDIVWLLQTGMKPDSDNVQGLMSESTENGYVHLPLEDLHAIAEYLSSLPPIHLPRESKTQESEMEW